MEICLNWYQEEIGQSKAFASSSHSGWIMTSLTILKENLTRETFLVELSRARAKGAQLATNLVTFAWAPFHSIKTSGLNFRQLPYSTEWNSIFAIYTQIFENYHREVFFPHSNLLPNVSGWKVRISETFPEVWKLFRENTVPIAAVSKAS